MDFSNIFDKFGKVLTGLQFPLISFLPFLYKVVRPACLRISRNDDNFMELLKLLQRKLLKISMFSFKAFIEISEPCDALILTSFKISLSICF